jgi:hypothetical protein
MGVLLNVHITISEMSQNRECFYLRGEGGCGRASQVEFGYLWIILVKNFNKSEMYIVM